MEKTRFAVGVFALVAALMLLFSGLGPEAGDGAPEGAVPLAYPCAESQIE